MEQLEHLLRDVWMSRILVTIGIVVLVDIIAAGRFPFKTRTQQQQQQQPSPPPILDGGIKDEQKNEDMKSATGSSTSVLLSSEPETEVCADGASNDSESIVEMTNNDVSEMLPEDVAEAPLDDSRGVNDNRSSAPAADATATTTVSQSVSGRTGHGRRPRIVATSNGHPGMADFAYWYDVETSLYRIYTLTRKDGVQVVPPYIPNSRRGNVSIFLHVTNGTNHTINVYWVDYKGKHILKGKMNPNHVWTQKTYIDHRECSIHIIMWIGECVSVCVCNDIPLLSCFFCTFHAGGTTAFVPCTTLERRSVSHYVCLSTLCPLGCRFVAWVFEDANDSTPYLHYIPYRAIPTLPSARTVSTDDETVAQHRFSFIPCKPNDEYLIGIRDDIMPHPGLAHFFQPLVGTTWTLTHMSRSMSVHDPSVDILQKYLTNIIHHPEVVKYRQIRIASRHFAPIWQSPMRGLLLAVGFIDRGMYTELGCEDAPLSRERVQDVALLSYLLAEWKTKPTWASSSQPGGAEDGFGRAGFGRAGTINSGI